MMINDLRCRIRSNSLPASTDKKLTPPGIGTLPNAGLSNWCLWRSNFEHFFFHTGGIQFLPCFNCLIHIVLVVVHACMMVYSSVLFRSKIWKKYTINQEQEFIAFWYEYTSHIFLSRASFYPSCLWATLQSPFWQTPIHLWCLSCFLMLNQSYIHRMKPICHEISYLCIVTGIFLFWIFWCMTHIVIRSSYYKVYIKLSAGAT